MRQKIFRFLYTVFLKYNGIYRTIFWLSEPEVRLIPMLMKNRKKTTAVDIGANIGLYTKVLSKHFKKVEAFEPLSDVSKYIEKKKLPNVCIHNIVLSNETGKINLYTPIKKGVQRYGNSSLEQTILNKFDQTVKTIVQMDTLDNFNLKNIDFIKIDVEGHELKVLEGARQTIVNNRPIIQIEIEARHLPKSTSVKELFGYFEKLDYRGCFLLNNKLHSLDQFKLYEHQQVYLGDNYKINLSNRKKAKLYVNNFFMIPNEKKQSD